jgi:hypothetical protein
MEFRKRSGTLEAALPLETALGLDFAEPVMRENLRCGFSMDDGVRVREVADVVGREEEIDAGAA